jgi:hypothetical protein
MAAQRSQLGVEHRRDVHAPAHVALGSEEVGRGQRPKVGRSASGFHRLQCARDRLPGEHRKEQARTGVHRTIGAELLREACRVGCGSTRIGHHFSDRDVVGVAVQPVGTERHDDCRAEAANALDQRA